MEEFGRGKNLRTKKSLTNIKFAFIGQLISYVSSFVIRTFFVYYLGKEYLGIMGLFTNIISILSLAELGIGNAVVFSLYKPIAEDNKESIAKIMRFFGKTYRIICFSIFSLGLILLPFLDMLINGVNNVDNLYLIYLLFLFDASITYLFSYRRLLFFANQKNYLNIKITTTYTILLNLLQILILVFTRNYIFFLLMKIVINFAQNYTIYLMVGKKYPYLTLCKEHISKSEEKKIWYNVKYVLIYRIGGMVISSTDNILISIFLSTKLVGIYSNYVLIISAINAFIIQIFSSISASIGNLNVLENNEKKYNIYKVMAFMSFWIYTICGISLLNLLNPFITLWLGAEYLLTDIEVLIVVMNFYFFGMIKNVSEIYINAMGLFKYVKLYPIFGAIINITVSIFLVRYIGLIGIFIGTIICYFSIYFWVWPYIIYKYGFHKKLTKYFLLYFKYIFFSFGISTFTYLINIRIPSSSVRMFFVKLLISLTVPNIIICLICRTTSEFKYLLNLFKNIKVIRKLLRK